MGVAGGKAAIDHDMMLMLKAVKIGSSIGNIRSNNTQLMMPDTAVEVCSSAYLLH